MPKDDESVYVPELSALLNKDQRISNRTGDVGVIDWVILCSCQDDGGLGYRVTVPAATATTAIAKVALELRRQIRPHADAQAGQAAAGLADRRRRR